MNFLQLPKRTSGNRSHGITSIVDFGISIGELTNVLMDYHNLIDIAKIGIGSAYVSPKLQEKVRLYQEFNIKPYFGGTLFEKCFHQQKLLHYFDWLKELGVEWVEVSNGTFDIPLSERLKIIHDIKDHFHILAEVGSKDTKKRLATSEWINEINQLLQAGCQYVITEGRDSGTAGIYNQDGAVDSGLVHELITAIDYKRIIFEAPTPKQQMYFINEVGPNVNLGNVKISDILLLEAQRQGLRSETFFLEEREWKLPL